MASQGRLQDAEALLRQLRRDAGTLKDNIPGGEEPVPIRAEIVARLGLLLVRQNRVPEAINALREAIELGAPRHIQVLFSRCVSTLRFSTADSALKALLVRAYREHWYLPADLARTACSALTVEPCFVTASRKLKTTGAQETDLTDADIRSVMADPLLLALLNSAIIPDDNLERLLTDFRRILLHQACGPAAASIPVSFCAALANQCLANEYAFAETDEESAEIASLVKRLSGNLQAEPAPRDICLVAAYRPLSGLDWAQQIAEQFKGSEINNVIVRQIEEPLRERNLEAAIPKLTAITNPLSVRVQKQYEENPYPRWDDIPPLRKQRTLSEWLTGNLPRFSPTDIPAGPFKLLVAGCGTGMEIVTFNTLFKDVTIDAFDLSSRSLAYAARKISELGLSNVHLGQADLLEMEQWPHRYDVVAASGVLHHLDDPVRGWHILANLVNPGGFMLIALYSEAGRRDVTALTQFARDGGYGVTPQELRRFRADILALPAQNPLRQYATGRDDFYNLSMLRDMVFHVSEQRFTVARIGDALRELKLDFCGFMVEPDVRTRFRQRFGDSSAGSLPAWEIFEREYPGAFSQMYHFVARKPR